MSIGENLRSFWWYCGGSVIGLGAISALLGLAVFAQCKAAEARRQRPPPQQSMHHAAPQKQLRSCAMPMQVTAITCAGSSLCFACGSSACWQFVPTRDGCEVLYR